MLLIAAQSYLELTQVFSFSVLDVLKYITAIMMATVAILPIIDSCSLRYFGW